MRNATITTSYADNNDNVITQHCTVHTTALLRKTHSMKMVMKRTMGFCCCRTTSIHRLLVAASLCVLWLLISVEGFQQPVTTLLHQQQQLRTTTTTSTTATKSSSALRQSSRDRQGHHSTTAPPSSWRSPLFRSTINSHSNKDDDDDDTNDASGGFPSTSLVWKNRLLAIAAVVTLATASTAAVAPPAAAHASLDISPGLTVLETSPDLTPRKLIQTSAGTAFQAARTVSGNQKELLQSLKRLQAAASTEVSSTLAWQELWSLLQSYGATIGSQVTIRPPADLQRTLQDVVQEGKVNFLVNGEVVQVSLEYQKPTAAEVTEGSGGGEGESSSTDSAVDVLPDDRWILKIEGYKGLDPTAIDVAALTASKSDATTPGFLKDFFDYCQTPYPTKYLSDFLVPTREGQRPVTYGDILVLEGTLAVGFLYAWSYAYYWDQIEQAEKAANAKKKKVAAPKKKEGGAAAKEAKQAMKKKQKKNDESTTWVTPPPPADSGVTAVAAAVVEEPQVALAVKDTKKSTTKTKSVKNAANSVEEIKVETEEDVKVSIDFDAKGQMVITATENKSRDGVFAFAQALCFPWLGMLVPSLTAPETVVISSSDEEETEGLFPLLRSLYVPWLGILQGK